MILKIVLILMVITAFLTVSEARLRVAAVYMGFFSLLSSLCYLLFSAPDVAISEAVIGCAISTALFLVALKKYRVYKVYFCFDSSILQNAKKLTYISNSVENILKKFCTDRELDLHIIHTSGDEDCLRENNEYDLFVCYKDNGIFAYASSTNYNAEILEKYIKDNNIAELRVILT